MPRDAEEDVGAAPLGDSTGGQPRALGRKDGNGPSQLNKMLHGRQVLSKRVIKALKLRVVFIPDDRKEGARGVKNRKQKVAAAPQKLFDALRELVEQIESGNGQDDHGHPLMNLKALRDARAIIDDAPRVVPAPSSPKQ
jgi:hypothetical protein